MSKGTAVLVLGIATGMVLCSGCGRKANRSVAGEAMAEKLMEKAMGGGAKVDIKGEQVHVKTKDGEMLVGGTEGLKVPDSFPKDVPVYKGAKVVQSFSRPDGQTLMLQTSDSGETIMDFYSKEMKSGGWSEEMAMRQEKGGMLAYKKEERIVNLVVSDTDDEGRMIHLNVASAK
jgi:hypothetical protein